MTYISIGEQLPCFDDAGQLLDWFLRILARAAVQVTVEDTTVVLEVARSATAQCRDRQDYGRISVDTEQDQSIR